MSEEVKNCNTCGGQVEIKELFHRERGWVFAWVHTKNEGTKKINYCVVA